ncbi:MAG: hypothetical protein ACYCPN_00850 [Thermoplasmata archaeon]
MGRRLHRGGRFRRWLGRRLGGDEALGDRAWRRILHGLGAGAIAYYLLPTQLIGGFSKLDLLLTLLGAVLLLEALRLGTGLDLPTVRPYERGRLASFAFFAISLTLALLLFPVPIGAATILGASWVDPLAGEFRLSSRYRRGYPVVPGLVYAGLATSMLVVWSPIAFPLALGVGAGMAVVALAAEYPKSRWFDDDLAMTLLPAAVAWGLAAALPPLAGLLH